MKAFKKVILATLIISLLFTSTAFAASKYTDTDSSPYQKAIEVLSALGVLNGYDDGTFLPENTITRAELAAVVTRAKGLDSVVETSDGVTGFSDVAQDHWASKNIAVAKDQGIISGYPDGTFKPDDPVTYEQVIKMLVAATGQTPVAVNNGGYPFGYIYVATSTGITDDLSTTTYTDNALRGGVAQLTFNALDVDLMVPTSVDADGQITYTSLPGKTMMTEYLKVQKNVGLVSGFGTTKLYPSVGNFKSDEAVISGYVLKAGDVDLSDLIGYTVDYYYKVDKQASTNTLIYASARDNQDVVKIDASNQGVISDMGAAGSKYTYWKNKDVDTRAEVLNIDPNFVMVYNNGPVSKMDMKTTDFDITEGNITWFDTNADDIYDLVIIKSYKSFGVQNATASSKVITFKDNSTTAGSIDLSKADKDVSYKVSYIFDNAPAAFEDIKPGNVVSIAQSKDGKSTEIVISDTKVSGKVDEIGTSSDGVKTYRVGDNRYEVAGEYKGDLLLGMETSFYLTFDNKIAYTSTSMDTSKFGFLLTVSYQPDGLETGAEFEILTVANERKVFTSKETIQFNDKPTPASDVVNSLKSGQDTNRQLVTYKADTNDKLLRISTKDGGADIQDPVIQGAPAIQNLVYRPNTPYASFKGQFYVDVANTIVFQFKNAGDLNQINTLDKKDISAKRVGDTGFDYNTYWDVLPFNLDESVAPILFLFSSGSTASVGSMFTYESQWPAVDADGEDIIKVKGYQNTKEVTFEVTEEDAINAFKGAVLGDSYFIGKNENNQIIAVGPAAIVSSPSSSIKGHLRVGSLGFGNEGDDKEVMCGLVMEVNLPNSILCATTISVEGSFNISDVILAKDKTRPFGVPSTITLVDIPAGKVSPKPSSEIKVGDIIVERSVYDGVQEMIVIRR